MKHDEPPRTLLPVTLSTLVAAGVNLVICAYYALVWLFVGRDPKPGTIVTRYTPPHGLSPAMLRYVWKERFDDRTFWAAVLDLVAYGALTIESPNGTPAFHINTVADTRRLPHEDRVLLNTLCPRHKGTLPINMLDGQTALAISRMADVLRRKAVGKWFRANREYVVTGLVLSLIAVAVVGKPASFDQLFALVSSLAMIGAGAFYLVFLCLRLLDLCRAAQKTLTKPIIARAALLLFLVVPCIAGVGVGILVLNGVFGWQVLTTAALLSAINATFLQLMKAPTVEGRRLLDEIEGFREFLHKVERLPMDTEQLPEHDAALYQHYLPYAVALDIEQGWADKFLALSSTCHKQEAERTAHSYYLGMWDGNPIEIVFTRADRR